MYKAVCVITSIVEKLYPMLPSLTKEQVGEEHWRSPEDYYFLDDTSRRLKQRWTDILTFNRSGVSFWRKREALLRK